MNILGRIAVFPTLPQSINRLEELAYNLWWSWKREAQALWREIDSELWEEVYHNPIKFLRDVAQEKLEEAANDARYQQAYQQVFAEFDEYMTCQDTWFKRTYPEQVDNGMEIAYFSAEFGLHESLPIYSGGLGILSGDHCKAASDLGLPFVGIGFLYPQGYFQQQLNADGWQHAVYNKLDLNEVPARPALDENGEAIMVQVELPGRTVSAQVWTIQVGRIQLLMMDTDVDPNAPSDRELAARLYGGDEEMRISQEIILGIGGVRALRKLGYKPTVWHMNEGHSAFMGLERVRQLVQERGLSFNEAVEAVRISNVFTTHTPVAAGHDAFLDQLVERYFYNYWPQLHIGRDDFLNLARQEMPWGHRFSMTVLAKRLSGQANGVSELHGQVSREMWANLWPGTPVDEIPISHITNGIHFQTWISSTIQALFDKHLPETWRNELDSADIWANVHNIPDAELLQVRKEMKQDLIDFIRQRVSNQYHRQGLGPVAVRKAEALFDPNALTIGFARRFATYKRATLIFRDKERLKRILNDPERPVQLVFSGKAHPKDEPGKNLIRDIVQISKEPGFEGKVILIEDYDMNVSRHMLAGVDIWLNNPRRPKEASGTSGEKAAMNGAPNFSVLDGWWREGWDGKNGWAIGEERSYETHEQQDVADVLSLYTTLEEEIVPRYYNEDLSDWMSVVKESIATITPQFNMQRMVKDYTNKLYIPAQKAGADLGKNGYALAHELAAWKQYIVSHWDQVRVSAEPLKSKQIKVGHPISLSATVHLGHLSVEDVRVEIVVGTEQDGQFRHPVSYPMSKSASYDNNTHRYEATFTPDQSGRQAYGIRLLPTHNYLMHAQEMTRVHWA